MSAEQALQTGRRITAVFQEDREKLRGLGRLASTTLRLQGALQEKPIATIATLTRTTGLTTPTVTLALRGLQDLQIVRETTGRLRGRIFAYTCYLDLLNAEDDGPRAAGQH